MVYKLLLSSIPSPTIFFFFIPILRRSINYKNIYRTFYRILGIYDVHIRIGGHHIPNSPFRVNVSSDVDATKVYARGPGLEPTGVIVNRPAKFEVVTSGAGHGNVHVDIIDPKGNKKTELQIEDQGNGIFACQYLPSVVGKYVICIKFGDSEIAKSPFRVQVEKAATRVNIYGPGLCFEIESSVTLDGKKEQERSDK